MRGSTRLSALSELGIYVLTHDSIGAARPTHQPIETIPSLRAMLVLVFRPGDGNETSGAYKIAIQLQAPQLLCSAAGDGQQANSSIDKVALGGYVLEDCDGTPDLIRSAPERNSTSVFRPPNSSAPTATRCVWSPCRRTLR